jgi:hypothetical protein
MTLKPLYNIQTKTLEWFVDGVYLPTTHVQSYFDKKHKIDHQVKDPTWGIMD